VLAKNVEAEMHFPPTSIMIVLCDKATVWSTPVSKDRSRDVGFNKHRVNKIKVGLNKRWIKQTLDLINVVPSGAKDG